MDGVDVWAAWGGGEVGVRPVRVEAGDDRRVEVREVREVVGVREVAGWPEAACEVRCGAADEVGLLAVGCEAALRDGAARVGLACVVD